MIDRPVTLITGSRKGIGRHLVGHYIAQGHMVVGCSRQPVQETISGYQHVCADVSDEMAVKNMMLSIWETYGRLDNIINNAGLGATGHFLLTPTATARRVYETNVIGAIVISREGTRLMKKRRSGRLINFTSTSHRLKAAGTAVYASSKAAIESLTQILAQELAPFGITVNAIGPSLIRTDMTAEIMSEEQAQAYIDRHAIRRVGSFADVAHVVDFFLHPSSAFVTGQVLYLGGA